MYLKLAYVIRRGAGCEFHLLNTGLGGGLMDDAKALQSALTDISDGNLSLHASHARLQGEIQSLQALLLESNHRMVTTARTLMAASRISARAAARALGLAEEAHSSTPPAVLEAARKADEAAIVTLGSVVELQNCLHWVAESTRSLLAGQPSPPGGAA